MALVSKTFPKTLVLWVVLIVAFVAIYNVMAANPEPRLDWATVQDHVQEGRVERLSVTVREGQGDAVVVLNDGHATRVESRPLADFTALQAKGVMVVFTEAPTNSLFSLLATWLPIVVIFLFFVFFMRRLQGQGKNAQDILKFEPTPTAVTGPVTLQGLTEARAALKAAAEAARTGAPGPRRVLITGPSGSGKTALLRALAVDTGLPFFAFSGAQFVEVFVGTGAARIRKLFEAAAAAQPCLVALDDIDAFASRRVLPDTEGRIDERATTLLELANRLDGLTPFPPKVLFLCTSSRPDLLDEALTRPGRTDLRLDLPPASPAHQPG